MIDNISPFSTAKLTASDRFQATEMQG